MKLIRRLFRRKVRVYIMPTRMGGYFNGLIFLLFLLATGYSNNLLLIFTICLFALNLLWLIQTHFHLHKLKLESVRVQDGHAADSIPVTVRWKNIPTGPWDWQLKLEDADHDFVLQRLVAQEMKQENTFSMDKRGMYDWKYLRVQTERPFGLYRAWIFFPVNAFSFVYPKILKNAQFNLNGKVAEGEIPQDVKGSEGFRGLATYHGGESRKISWKHYARTGELFEKEGEELRIPSLDLVLNLPEDGVLKENYLSAIATQMVECQKKQIPFSLKSSKVTLAAGNHLSHLHDCLKVLAQC